MIELKYREDFPDENRILEPDEVKIALAAKIDLVQAEVSAPHHIRLPGARRTEVLFEINGGEDYTFVEDVEGKRIGRMEPELLQRATFDLMRHTYGLDQANYTISEDARISEGVNPLFREERHFRRLPADGLTFVRSHIYRVEKEQQITHRLTWWVTDEAPSVKVKIFGIPIKI